MKLYDWDDYKTIPGDLFVIGSTHKHSQMPECYYSPGGDLAVYDTEQEAQDALEGIRIAEFDCYQHEEWPYDNHVWTVAEMQVFEGCRNTKDYRPETEPVASGQITAAEYECFLDDLERIIRNDQ